MTSIHQHWIGHLAAADSFTHLGQRFQRQYSGWQVSHVFMLMFVVVAAVAVGWLVSRYVRQWRGEGNCPRALFAQLCRAHGFGWFARRLLLQLARHQRLTSPAQLFVEPEHFETDRLNDALRARMNELLVLRDKMFGAEWCKTNLQSN